MGLDIPNISQIRFGICVGLPVITMQHANHGSVARPRRPPLSPSQRAIVALALLLVFVALGNFIRAGMALAYAARLPRLPMTTSWGYLAGYGLWWGIVFAGAVVGLVRQRRWGRWLALVGATLYQAHGWVNHLLLDANDYARMTWPRDLVLTALFLAAAWGVLCWPSVRRTFD